MYLRFLLSNPDYLLFQPFREDGVLKFLFPLASWVPAKPCNNVSLRTEIPPGFRYPVPAPINRVLRGDSPAWILSCWGIVAVLSIVALAASTTRKSPWLLPGVLLVASFPHLLLVWHGDAMDVTRHALLVGIQVHLFFAMIAALSLDSFWGGWIERRRRVRSQISPRAAGLPRSSSQATT